jgi:hypothetical protein
MKPSPAVVALLLVGTSCASRPPLVALPPDAQASAAARCQQAFPRQPWRATHTLVASLPTGLASGLIGVLSAGSDGLRAVLLSPEGIRLFDGVQRHGGSGGLTILRAVPPLDHSDFAPTLMADVGAAFLPPAGLPAVGTNAAGATVCRFGRSGPDATEVELGRDGPVRIRSYRNAQVVREIALSGSPDRGFFPHLRLVAPLAGYTLDITLVDHD